MRTYNRKEPLITACLTHVPLIAKGKARQKLDIGYLSQAVTVPSPPVTYAMAISLNPRQVQGKLSTSDQSISQGS